MNSWVTFNFVLTDVLRRIYFDSRKFNPRRPQKRGGRRLLKRPDWTKVQQISVPFSLPDGYHTMSPDDVIETVTRPLAEQLAPLCRHFKRFAVLPHVKAAEISDVVTGRDEGLSARAVRYWNPETRQMECRIDIAGY